VSRPTSDTYEPGHSAGIRPAVDPMPEVTELDAMHARDERRAAFRFLTFCALWALIFGACCCLAAL
jgi:hypothetical protein